jgi:hypothetical protein
MYTVHSNDRHSTYLFWQILDTVFQITGWLGIGSYMYICICSHWTNRIVHVYMYMQPLKQNCFVVICMRAMTYTCIPGVTQIMPICIFKPFQAVVSCKRTFHIHYNSSLILLGDLCSLGFLRCVLPMCFVNKLTTCITWLIYCGHHTRNQFLLNIKGATNSW